MTISSKRWIFLFWSSVGHYFQVTGILSPDMWSYIMFSDSGGNIMQSRCFEDCGVLAYRQTLNLVLVTK